MFTANKKETSVSYHVLLEKLYLFPGRSSFPPSTRSQSPVFPSPILTQHHAACSHFFLFNSFDFIFFFSFVSQYSPASAHLGIRRTMLPIWRSPTHPHTRPLCNQLGREKTKHREKFRFFSSFRDAHHCRELAAVPRSECTAS